MGGSAGFGNDSGGSALVLDDAAALRERVWKAASILDNLEAPAMIPATLGLR